MNQRTCSHRISELYNEIILNSKFKKEYTVQKSFYKDNFYITIFKNDSFKVKLLILDKENKNIIFENICNESFIICNDVREDVFLYSIDTKYSQIDKFKNPILNNGLIENFVNRKHPFISLSKKINDILIKDDLLYFSVNINGIVVENDKKVNIELTKERNYLTVIDKISDAFVFQEISLLIGINTSNLKEISRDNFLKEIAEYHPTGFAPPIKIFNKTLNKRNTILIEVYNSFFMEKIVYLIDYSQGITKQLHPPYLVQTSNSYLLILPYYGYNSFSNFRLIRLSDLCEIDLYQILPNQVIEYFNELDFENLFFGDTCHQFLKHNFLFIGNYEFSCANLFSATPKIQENVNFKRPELKSLLPIECGNLSGYALDIHTIKSTLLSDGGFETTRTHIGELLFRLKYQYDKSAIEEIASKCSEIILSAFNQIDVIIPVPPSNLGRPFQPVFEVAKRISELTKIKIDFSYVTKLPTEQIKTLNNQEDRNIILDRAISIKDERYQNMNILLFDDLYRSGNTLTVISKKALTKGKVNSVKVLCITKTRTKK